MEKEEGEIDEEMVWQSDISSEDEDEDENDAEVETQIIWLGTQVTVVA